MVHDRQRMNALLDAYGPLLTKRQLDSMELYYKEDFSLAEIAEQFAISRTAVSDHIKRSAHILEEYEKKLHLVANYEKRNTIYGKIKAIGTTQVQGLIDILENME